MIDKDTKAQDCTANNLYNVLPAVPSIVYNDDCMHGLKRFPDKCFDLAIVDPPYGIDINNQSQGKGGGVARKIEYTKKDWDKTSPGIDYFNELRRVSKNQIIWGGNYYDLPKTKGWIIWKKMDITNDFNPLEMAWTSDLKLGCFDFLWCGMLQQNRNINEERIHPTQKPIALYEWLLMNYASEGDLILDTHVGSGSSRIACAKCGFNFVGFEIDKEYFDAQEKRFKLFESQKRLF